MTKGKPSDKNKTVFQKNRRRYLMKYSMLQNHHIPGMVFLHHATKHNGENLSLSQMVILGTIYMHIKSDEKGNNDVFAPKVIYDLITKTYCYDQVNNAFAFHVEKKILKKISRGKYIMTEKGFREIKNIAARFSQYFYLYEQNTGNFNFLE